jgi:hypothetical protein
MDLEDFSEADLMLNLEGQILNALTKHGGQIIQAGPQMDSLIKDFIEDVLTHPDRRRWAAEYLRRLQLIDGEADG